MLFRGYGSAFENDRATQVANSFPDSQLRRRIDISTSAAEALYAQKCLINVYSQ